MAEIDQAQREKTLMEVVEQVDRYSIEAFHFVQQGLGFTVERIHGGLTDPIVNRHVSGRQLCEGLRDFALIKWGRLARTVLRRWHVNATVDFGNIVFAMVDNGLMQKNDDDTIDDFRDVFDFSTAFESTYRVPTDMQERRSEVGK